MVVDETSCQGITFAAREVTRIDEGCIQRIKTVGNEESPEGLRSTTNSTIGDPGIAIGASVVNSLENNNATLGATQASPIRD
jgi:hypothetical protein